MLVTGVLILRGPGAGSHGARAARRRWDARPVPAVSGIGPGPMPLADDRRRVALLRLWEALRFHEMSALKFNVVFEDAGDGWVYAHVQELPEVHTQG